MPHPMLIRDQPYVPDKPRNDVAPPPSFLISDFMLGLDLGALVDPSAASVIRRTFITDDVQGPDGQVRQVLRRTPRGALIRRFDVLALKRYPLGTPYTAIVDHIRGQVRRFPKIPLVVDASGVGRPIVDMFRDLLLPLEAITITGGNSWSHPKFGEWHVSKVELVGAVRAALETEKIKISPGVEHRDILKEELTNFKITISKSENEIYSAREGLHDDLVLSIALPIWLTWAMDQSQPYIVGSHKVDMKSPRNPLRITANVAGLFAGRQPELTATAAPKPEE